MLVVKMTDQFAEHEIVRHEIIGHENAGREHDGPKMKAGREIAGKPSRYVTSHPGQLSLPSLLGR